MGETQHSNLDIKRSSSATQQHQSDEGLGKDGDKVTPENTDAKQVSEFTKSPKSDVEKATELLKEATTIKIERHKVHVMEHNLVVSGVKVCEKKESIAVTQEDFNQEIASGSKPLRTIVIHSRSIDDRKYSMEEVKDIDGNIIENKAITEMSDDEIKKFEEDWKDFWIPTISDEQIESGEFQNELQEIDIKKAMKNVSSNNSEKQKIQVDQADEVYQDTQNDEVSMQDMKAAGGETIISEPKEVAQSLRSNGLEDEISHGEELLEVLDSPIEEFVKDHPLQVFYFGVAMLVIAILVLQCCFLPEYPPCTWFKCIL